MDKVASALTGRYFYGVDESFRETCVYIWWQMLPGSGDLSSRCRRSRYVDLWNPIPTNHVMMELVRRSREILFSRQSTHFSAARLEMVNWELFHSRSWRWLDSHRVDSASSTRDRLLDQGRKLVSPLVVIASPPYTVLSTRTVLRELVPFNALQILPQ